MKNKLFRLATKLTTVAMVVSMMSAVMPANAANYTLMSDVMARMQADVNNNHTVTFTTGSAWHASDTVIIDLSAVTSAPSATVTDVDLSFDSGDKTLVASGCAANEIQVGIAGGVFTFTLCAGSTALVASKVIIAEFGSVAAGGSDAHLKTLNSTGAKTISLSGSIGDSGSIQTYLLTSDQITVTATVDPAFAFKVGAESSACSQGPTAYSPAGYTVALGTLATDKVYGTGQNSAQYICNALNSNATNYTVVTVKSEHNALQSASATGDQIVSATDPDVDKAEEHYGLCYKSDSGYGKTAGADPDPTAPYDVTCTVSDADNQSIGELDSTSAQEVWRVTGATSEAYATLMIKAAIAVTTKAHNDYHDVLTFVATGTF